jgi:hypothetical protein
MLRPLRTPLLLAVALAAAAAPVQAQLVFRTDTQGPTLTGAGLAGSHGGPGFHDAHNALFLLVDDAALFRSAQIACGIVAGAHRLAEELHAASLAMPPGFPPLAPSAEAQRTVYAVMVEGDSTGPAAGRLLGALRGGAPPHGADDEAARLVRAIAGLLRDGEACPAEPRIRRPEGTRWYEAFTAYKVYLHAAPAAALDPPSDELVAVGAVLHRLVQDGLAARRP